MFQFRYLLQSFILLIPACPVAIADDGSRLDFDLSGIWETDYGQLKLTQTGTEVLGTYPGGSLQGRIENQLLSFHFKDLETSGEGKFTFDANGSSFSGQWKDESWDGEWRPWGGKRSEVKLSGFAGLWDSSFGPVRLVVEGTEVHGEYDYASGRSTIKGEINGKRLIFRYKEPAAEGIGWFELAEDGKAFQGAWRPDGEKEWSAWTGVKKIAVPGKIWLFIVEANWETSIEEPQYAFGEMLENYFRMAAGRHVQVRHRFFHDSQDLERFCVQIQFLAEPTVLLISTHGTSQGITVSGETITADVLAKNLKTAGNLILLHLSGCGMMASDFPQQIFDSMDTAPVFAISGYKTNVAWDASAIGDFTFLSLVLLRGLSPEEAVAKAIIASPYLGDQPIPDSAFAPLGLSILVPSRHVEPAINAELQTIDR